MRLIFWDCETSPNTAYSFNTYKAFIAPNQIIEPSRILCWAAKERGSRTIHYADERGGHKKMIQELHKVLSDADGIVTYNGINFDQKVANAEFVKYGLTPIPPTKQIDLYKVVRKHFRLPSSKLEYVSKAFGIGEKVKHQGFQLWKDCMAGDEKAWAVMTKYNKVDCKLLESLYEKLLPWIPAHPNRSLEAEATCCPVCGSENLQRRGNYRTKVASYSRFCCKSCGSWSRSRISDVHPDNRQAIMVPL